VQDRLYFIDETGELYMNGKPYNGNDGSRDWLCFTALVPNSSVALNKINSPYNPISLETSTDGETWTAYTWTGNTGATITLANVGDKVYWRGNNNVPLSYWYNNTASWHQFVTAGSLDCSGNIMSLFDKLCKRNDIPMDEDHGGTGMVSLFKDATIVTAPKLPATELYHDCYNDMFDGSAIVTAPELPALTMYRNTYAYMFKNCAKLVNAPKLPSTTLDEGCYKYMFQNCVALKEAPYLPATMLATDCYANMFEGCTSLSEIPAKLPATTLALRCYSNMFKSCSSLRKPTALPATTMVMSCYENMFNATDLREVPELPATELAQQCYGGMFIGCRNLERIPLNYLQATTLQVGCYQWMFVNCTALKVGCRLPATVMASQCYAHMYDGCTSLVDSERINATTLANGCMNQMFKGCTNLTRLMIPNMTAFDESATPAWLSGLSYKRRAFVCNENLDTSVRNESRIPESWIPTRGAYTGDAMVNMWYMSNMNSVTFAPTNSEQDMIPIYQNITLNAIGLPNGYIGTAQAFIYYPPNSSYSITAGEGIDFVDTPHKGYLSRVVITWNGLNGRAALRVMWEVAL
jgi:hypothetical protein